MVNADGQQVVLAAVVGLVLSVGLEKFMSPQPRPVYKRTWPCIALHGGLWLAVFSTIVLLLARPWFAMVIQASLMLLVVVVNNAKFASLREPFVFQDYEYFTDAILHPRLYIPFLGWGKAVAAALGFAAAVFAGLWFEAAPADRWSVSGQMGVAALTAVVSLVLIGAGNLGKVVATFAPTKDILRMGLLASLWCYARAEKVRPTVHSPFSAEPSALLESADRPHLVAVQSESFFDPRDLFSGVRRDVLRHFDDLKKSALSHGKLTVPAWGANTVRSEFAFLTGVSADTLGVHRFNPYRRVVDWGVPTLAGYLQKMGYKTICVHPYPSGFYGRDRIYPMLGFDEFIDIRAFKDSDRSGAYTGDIAVAKKISTILENASVPVFIHVITMENHGPLHLEAVSTEDIKASYDQLPPAGCDDLTAYIKHLRNADTMISMLSDTMNKLDRHASLCWFGDHVPIMQQVYKLLGLPGGQTEFLIWQNRKTTGLVPENLQAHHLVDNLADKWLSCLGLLAKK